MVSTVISSIFKKHFAFKIYLLKELNPTVIQLGILPLLVAEKYSNMDS